MNECGIKEWNIDIGLSDKEPDSRTAEDDALCTILSKFHDNVQIYVFGLFRDFSEAQFIVNNLIDDIDISVIWNDDLNPLFDQNIFIEILLHGIFRTEQADFSDAVFL